METYITTIIPFVTRQATYSFRLWDLQFTLAMMCARDSLPSLVFDQEPTSHAAQVSYILGLTHSIIWRDTEARSRNHCCRGKASSITNVCVLTCFWCHIIFSTGALSCSNVLLYITSQTAQFPEKGYREHNVRLDFLYDYSLERYSF